MAETTETFVAIHNGIGRTVVFREDYDALHTRLRAAERDAARYRWLRSTALDADSLDAEIDAALAALAGSAQEEGR
jgi:hypothetical protein